MNTHRSNGSGNNCCGTSKPIMWGLEGENLAAFERIRHFLPFKGNQTVFYEGHVCLGLYVLCKGRVKITRSSTRGERLIVSILEAGEIIEKHALGQHAVHEVTCETLEPSHIALIEREPYLALVKQNSNLALKLIQMLSGEVGFQMEQLERFTFRNARERLAGLLMDLGKRFGRSGTTVFVSV